MDFLFYLDWSPRLAHLYTGFNGVFPGVYRSPTLCRRVTCLLVLFFSWMRPIRTYRTAGMTIQRLIFCPTYNLLFFVVSFTWEKRRKKAASVRTYPRWQGWRKGESTQISNKYGPGSDPGVDTIWKVFSTLFFFSSVPKNQPVGKHSKGVDGQNGRVFAYSFS